MKKINHWSPRYFKNLIKTMYYEKTNSSYPWLTIYANKILDSYLQDTDIGLEFGSGRSTIWFAKRIAYLTSVEHNPEWSINVQNMIKKSNINNVDYKLLPIDEEHKGIDAEYVKVIEKLNDNSLDFCLIDGIYREFCALKVINKIRPGGLLIIDNVERYLPSNSISPNPRSLTDGPNGPTWEEVHRLISDWRKIWTSSGVTDTAFFFKPYN